MTQAWTLSFPAPDRWLSANDSGSWMGRYRTVREWRATTYRHAQAARLPKGLARVRVAAVLRFTDRRHRDIDNYRSTIKPCVDALTARTRYGSVAPGWGLIPDDTPAYLDGPYVTIGDPVPRKRYGPVGVLVLTITDLSHVEKEADGADGS